MYCSSDKQVNMGKYGEICLMHKDNDDNYEKTSRKCLLVHKLASASDARALENIFITIWKDSYT